MRIDRFVCILAGILMLSACSSQVRTSSESSIATKSAEIQLCSSCIQLCNSCHYSNGTSAGPDFPKIAGQYDVYLVKAVENFRKGHRESETMQRIASLHTEEEMKKLARYFASQQPDDTPSISSPNQILLEWGKDIYEADRIYGIACADCHGYDGMGYAYKSPRMSKVRAIPRLAGQSHVYLASAVQKYVDGKFENGMCTMRKAGKTLVKDDANALVEYLSSLTPPER